MDLRFWNRPRICTRRMILEALEERIVMDAAVDSIPQDNPFAGRHMNWDVNSAVDAWHADGGRHLASFEKIMPGHSSAADLEMGLFGAALPQAQTAAVNHDALSEVFANKGLDIVLVSTDTDKFDAISHAVSNGAKTLLYDPHEESLQSISNKLHDLTDSVGQKIEHLAIVAPGAAGHLKIGADDITTNTVDAHQGEFKALAQSLTSDARIDLYGCDIAQGQEGSSLVNKVASATGVTVWASNDVTGTVPGANWDLEVKSASDAKPYMIDASALAGYQIHLADPIPGPDPDHHVNKTATGIYPNLTLNATDTDQPPVTNVTFTVVAPLPTNGSVVFDGDPTELSPGAYEQAFTFTASPTTYTGSQTINYTVSSQGFPDMGTVIADPGDYTVNCAAFGNINDDGIPDIVMGTDVGAYYMINNGDGTFAVPTLVPGTDTYNVTAIDLGPIMPQHVCGVVQDLVIGTNARDHWVENLSTSTVNWGNVRNIGVGGGADNHDTTAIKVANLGNGYGFDVIETTSDGAGAVLYSNTGVGPNYLNGAGVQISAGTQSMHALAVANVDQQPGNDVILGVDGAQIEWYHGNNDGTVDTTAHYVGAVTDTYDTLSLLVTDVNNDTFPDIVQGNGSGQDAYVYDNGGAGAFSTAGVSVPDVTWPKGIQFADMNGDGNNDLLFGNLYGPNLYFLGDGAGNFSSPGIPLNADNNSTVAISADPNWVTDPEYYPALDVVVINGTLTYDTITEAYPQRLYSWGTQTADGVYTLTIDPFNRPPVDMIDGSSNFLTHPQAVDPMTGTLVFSTANNNALTVHDPDALTDPIVVTLTAENGNSMYLGPTVPGTLVVTGDGTDQIVLTGPQDDINTALEGLLYRSHRDRYVDSEGLVIEANDQGHNRSGDVAPGVPGVAKTDTERVSISVDVLTPELGGDAWWNEAPHNLYNGADIGPTNPLVPPTTDINGQVTFAGPSRITVWDPDANPATDPIIVTLLPTGGDIRLTSTTPAGVVLDPLGDNTTGALSLTGTQNAINSALDGLTFRLLPSIAGSLGPAGITIVSDDQGYNDHNQYGLPVQNMEYTMTDTDTIPITVGYTNPFWGRFPRR